jgi:hypothetical protein
MKSEGIMHQNIINNMMIFLFEVLKYDTFIGISHNCNAIVKPDMTSLG